MHVDGDNEGERAALTAELEAALTRELMAAWDEVNASRFHRALSAPLLALVDASSFLGQWQRDTRTIALSRAFVLGQPWRVVVEVLKHEMAHQFTHEVLGAVDESAHGPAFRSVCARLGIDAAAAGIPDAPSGVEERVLRRIERLLALAGSSNRHEAESAMATAQKLMLQHNVSAAEAGERRGFTFRQLGEPSARLQLHEKLLANILSAHFFVRVILMPAYRPRDGGRGSVIEICGTRANVEMASHVHAFLLRSAAALWGDHKRERGITSDRDRLSFFAGVMRGFQEKLQKLRVTHESEGLVWVGDGELSRFFEQRHPHIRRTRLAGRRLTDAHHQGREAGRQIVLHRPLADDVAARGRLLPERRG